MVKLEQNATDGLRARHTNHDRPDTKSPNLSQSNGAVTIHINGTLPTKTHSATPLNKTISILQIHAPSLLTTFILIFGGCCSNVYTLETLIRASPSSGTLITFVQFLMTSLITSRKHISFRAGWRNFFLRERNIPVRKWVVFTVLFVINSVLNNLAFKYHISVPLHIILRSAGPVASMVTGRLVAKKRYPMSKVIAVIMLSGGVICAAISDAWAKQQQSLHSATSFSPSSSSTSKSIWSQTSSTALLNQAPGLIILTIALVLGALLGLYTDWIYATHGRGSEITSETLFYSHTLALPTFLFRLRPIISELNLIMTPSTPIDSSYSSNTKSLRTNPVSDPSPINHLIRFLLRTLLPLQTPLLLALVLNSLTQYLCITGVNRLSVQSSSLTVAIVLNIRKLVSLMISIWVFGNELPLGVMVGAAVVFGAGGLYAFPTGRTGEDNGDKRTEKKQLDRNGGRDVVVGRDREKVDKDENRGLSKGEGVGAAHDGGHEEGGDSAHGAMNGNTGDDGIRKRRKF